MSLFDFPRINIKGTISFNPGTANNDDYAASAILPASWGCHAGEPLALIDSKNVEPRTYGMSDDDFVAWIQKAQTFDKTNHPSETTQIIPAEWNYYGDMTSSINATVIGVQDAPGSVYTTATTEVPLTSVLGSALSSSGGHFTDVNSEGSPPATQFFFDNLTLKQGNDTPYLNGAASKAASLWLNFYRNVNLRADGGAGGYAYHVMMKSDGTTINLPGFDDPNIVGVIFRYYLYRAINIHPGQSNADIEALYKLKGKNPKELEIVGTFAPLYADEEIFTMPTGRLMVSNTPNIPTPKGATNNGPMYALAPAVLKRNGNIISADFIGTFPDYYQDGNNPKFDFGEVYLEVRNEDLHATIDQIDYSNTSGGDAQGWVFDFDISANPKAKKILGRPNTFYQLVHPTHGVVLKETYFYFVSNQLAIYGEQHGSGDSFLNQGASEPATISVYRCGEKIDQNCPPINLWLYKSIPLEAPGDAILINANFKPGQPIEIDTSQPGNFLFTFSISAATNVPNSYSTFMNPPYITNAPSISLRILPNGVDFSQYYVDPSADEPIGNELLTFDVVYRHVLRTYYLLYPIMNKYVPLNDENSVKQAASAILHRTDPTIWMSNGFMPKTRDMSESRRTLLQAWCRKVQPS